MSEAAANDAPAYPAGTRFGKYEIKRCVGVGGMGSVYEALHTQLGKRAAVKVLHHHLVSDETTRARFLREGEAIARIQHPNVVDVMDVGVEHEASYLVMEFLEGESLHDFVQRSGEGTDERTAANMLVPVLAGLLAAHESGVIHRDLKPDNVFLAKEGSQVVPKILDFGISKVVAPGIQEKAITQMRTILGTPYYMAPEQMRDAGSADERTDLYALGVVLYEVLTGRVPFDAPTLLDLMNRVVSGVHEPLAQVRPNLPADFVHVVSRAMQVDPAQRFQSAAAFGRALLPYASSRVRAQFSASFGVTLESHAPPPLDTASGRGRVSPFAQTDVGANPTPVAVAIPVATATPARRPWVAVAILLGALGSVGAIAMVRTQSPASAGPPAAATRPGLPLPSTATPRVDPAPPGRAALPGVAAPRPRPVDVDVDVDVGSPQGAASPEVEAAAAPAPVAAAADPARVGPSRGDGRATRHDGPRGRGRHERSDSTPTSATAPVEPDIRLER